ncbi:hypothetical protein Tco_0748267 [Tanacetum coccineum]|uniref:Uncharacterized protein n=1 Tax=Tanacetum coccineum TaxID=301880 RepID=A0ABQ4YW25_9ASTR
MIRRDLKLERSLIPPYNSSSICSGFGPARDTCNFPESDQAGMLTSYVTVDVSTHLDLVTFRSCGFCITFCSFESDVDEDSWDHFLMYHHRVEEEDRSGNELLVLQLQRPFPCLLLHAVWELLLTLDP